LAKDHIRSSTIEELKLKLDAKETIETDNDMVTDTQHGSNHHQPHMTDNGLILPRKLPNPVLENADRQNLHRELLFNQKIGKNVLNQKSELEKVLAKHKDNQAKKELEETIAAKEPELKKVIADRARKLEEGNHTKTSEDEKGLSKEFLQARAKLKARSDSK